MARYNVLLHGSEILLRDEVSGEARLGGFYVNCCVAASDRKSAERLALDELYRHPTYIGLESRPAEGCAGPPPTTVDSVDKVPFWRRGLAQGIATGFIFYFVDTDQEPKGMTRATEGR